MFSKIQNPETGNWVNVNGVVGRKVLRNYVRQIGGANPLLMPPDDGQYEAAGYAADPRVLSTVAPRATPAQKALEEDFFDEWVTDLKQLYEKELTRIPPTPGPCNSESDLRKIITEIKLFAKMIQNNGGIPILKSFIEYCLKNQKRYHWPHFYTKTSGDHYSPIKHTNILSYARRQKDTVPEWLKQHLEDGLGEVSSHHISKATTGQEDRCSHLKNYILNFLYCIDRYRNFKIYKLYSWNRIYYEKKILKSGSFANFNPVQALPPRPPSLTSDPVSQEGGAAQDTTPVPPPAPPADKCPDSWPPIFSCEETLSYSPVSVPFDIVTSQINEQIGKDITLTQVYTIQLGDETTRKYANGDVFSEEDDNYNVEFSVEESEPIQLLINKDKVMRRMAPDTSLIMDPEIAKSAARAEKLASIDGFYSWDQRYQLITKKIADLADNIFVEEAAIFTGFIISDPDQYSYNANLKKLTKIWFLYSPYLYYYLFI